MSISFICPFRYIDTYIDLVPTKKILKEYLKTKNAEKYTIEYLKILDKLDPFKIGNDLNEKVILCWEKPNNFCHRFLVSKWLRSYKFEIEELDNLKKLECQKILMNNIF